jgi:cytochrome c oxidase cbb3-type subunit 3
MRILFLFICIIGLLSCRHTVSVQQSEYKTEGTPRGNSETGSVLYQSYCIPCHGEKGEGIIGPNLSDGSWVYGYSTEIVENVITKGTQNGMPEHNSKLTPDQIRSIADFVLNMKPTKGRDPEGKIKE